MAGDIPEFSLEVYDPSGNIEITDLYAPRLASLAGKTICEISNWKWESPRMFPVIRELLQRRFPDLKIIPYTEFPDITNASAEELSRAVREKGFDGAIVGNAA